MKAWFMMGLRAGADSACVFAELSKFILIHFLLLTACVLKGFIRGSYWSRTRLALNEKKNTWTAAHLRLLNPVRLS